MPPTATTPPPEDVSDLRRRLDELETRVNDLGRLMTAVKPVPAGPQRWWRAQVGAFADDPVYAEIARLGREWRDSQRPADDAARDATQAGGGGE